MSDFSAYKVQPITDMYASATKDAILYITKNGVTIILDEQEIIELAKAMEASFRR